MQQKLYNKGEVIFREDDVEYCMYDIKSGKVGIYADFGTEGQNLLTELESRMFFGEMGLIDSMPRSATAVALEDGTCLNIIEGQEFRDFLEGNPDRVLALMQHMSNRVRSLTVDYLSACKAISEAAAAGGKKKGWFKSSMKKFLQDYEKYAAYATAQPAMFYGASRSTMAYAMQYDPMQFHF